MNRKFPKTDHLLQFPAQIIGQHPGLAKQFEGIPVYHLDRIIEIVPQLGIRLAIIAVPSPSAQKVADALVAAGIEGILNFAPVTIAVPKHINLEGVDLAIELEQLSFAVANKQRRGS